ncbi:MAG TPA: glycosyltransferase family 4 protein [Solirubrobacterales bacterium]|nr:glycosyltransferase family 4 protein [Solirubrobacterales bacterium]
MRLGVYTDYPYHFRDGEPYGERAFVVFIARLASRFSRLAVFGRLDPSSSTRARYRLGSEVEFVPLPYYRTLGNPGEALRSLGTAMSRFWRGIADLDCVWLLGPNPFAVVFAVLAILRRKRIVLGVRQDYPAYVRARYPDRPGIRAMARVIDLAFRALARVYPVVAIGPQIAATYSRSPALLEIAVSLVEADEIVSPKDASKRSYEGERRVLSVGRLEEEKNPLLLAHALQILSANGQSWNLTVCGEGPMAGELESELDRLGVADRAELRGYVAQGDGLGHAYRDSHAFLHVSWTEGLPQVLLEAFAAGLPTVATDVGGIRQAVGDAVLLVPPGDPDAAADALSRIAADPGLRARLVDAGHEYVAARTLTRESMRVADFIIAGTAGDRAEAG